MPGAVRHFENQRFQLRRRDRSPPIFGWTIWSFQDHLGASKVKQHIKILFLTKFGVYITFNRLKLQDKLGVCGAPFPLWIIPAAPRRTTWWPRNTRARPWTPSKGAPWCCAALWIWSLGMRQNVRDVLFFWGGCAKNHEQHILFGMGKKTSNKTTGWQNFSGKDLEWLVDFADFGGQDARPEGRNIFGFFFVEHNTQQDNREQ